MVEVPVNMRQNVSIFAENSKIKRSEYVLASVKPEPKLKVAKISDSAHYLTNMFGFALSFFTLNQLESVSVRFQVWLQLS